MKRFEFIFPTELTRHVLFFAVVAGVFLCFNLRTIDVNDVFFVGFLGIVLLLFKFNLFYLYKITENGIENKHLSFDWHEIDKVEIVYTEQHRRNLTKIVYPPVACIGQVRKGGLFGQNRRQCVFFPITQRNLKLIQEYSKGENKALNDLISQYIDYPDEKIKIRRWGD